MPSFLLLQHRSTSRAQVFSKIFKNPCFRGAVARKSNILLSQNESNAIVPERTIYVVRNAMLLCVFTTRGGQNKVARACRIKHFYF
ncbi:MAG: hypothetical protein CVU81_02375 [Euryarchaeota archaeon HGW-Euryarchaeota-1]|nr:MAG: hypothetical protein CVU81_02375 [Euryarchaeota archaeon HGW-Euryarchaeota-1]